MVQHHYLQAHGLTLHVMTAGPAAGSPVLLLHGFPEPAASWMAQITGLADAGYFVIAPDQRGYNLSDAPGDVQSYQVTDIIADALAVMDGFGYEQFALVGHDWGGQIAWRMAAAYPERVQQLIMLNSPHPKAFSTALRTIPRQRRRSSYMLYFRYPVLPELTIRIANFAFLDVMLRRTSVPGTFSDAYMQSLKRAWSKQGRMTAMLNWYRAAYAFRHPSPKAKIAVPTLLINGMKDRFFVPELLEASAEYCVSVQVHRLPDATHWLIHEEPERINALMLDFLR